jgi:hypothetical protein
MTMRILQDLYLRLASPQPWDGLFIVGLLMAELLLGILIIDKVPYTEIDWEAYMQEVQMWFDDGIYDYRQIYGGTGPLVYPAGFLYLFTFLRWITNQGTNIRLAQFIFLGMYLLLQSLLLLIYTRAARFLSTTTTLSSSAATTKNKTKSTEEEGEKEGGLLTIQQANIIWSWRVAMGLCCCSKRLHSIFMLRLFNEGPTMLLLYFCLYFLINNHWNSGCFAFSYAVSIKMNVLLFAPGLLLLLIQQSRGNYLVVIRRLLVCCALPQLVLGAPFLLTYPESYLRKAFELDRVFFFKWTVNWKVGSFISCAFDALFLIYTSWPHQVLCIFCYCSLFIIPIQVSTGRHLCLQTDGTCFAGVSSRHIGFFVHPMDSNLPAPPSQTENNSVVPSLYLLYHVCGQFCGHCLCSNLALSILCLVCFQSAIYSMESRHISITGASSALGWLGVCILDVSSNTGQFCGITIRTPGYSSPDQTTHCNLGRRRTGRWQQW